VLGAGRELVGHGTILADLDLLLGDRFAGFSIEVLPFEYGLLLALLPPGAFIGLGLMVALRQYLLNRPQAQSASSPSQQESATS